MVFERRFCVKPGPVESGGDIFVWLQAAGVLQVNAVAVWKNIRKGVRSVGLGH